MKVQSAFKLDPQHAVAYSHQAILSAHPTPNRIKLGSSSSTGRIIAHKRYSGSRLSTPSPLRAALRAKYVTVRSEMTPPASLPSTEPTRIERKAQPMRMGPKL